MNENQLKDNQPVSELQNFIDSLPDGGVKKTIKEDEPKEEELSKKTEEDDDKGEYRKNRFHRRLEERLRKEMEEELSRAKAELRASVAPASETEPSAEFVALYGNTPEAKSFWNIQQKMLERVKTEAKDEAVKEFESRQEAVRREQREAAAEIDRSLESLEDTHGVDLTSDAPVARKARRELLELVESLSPKGEDGNIVAYADFGKAYELYRMQRSVQKPDSSQAKDIASRTMQRGNPSGDKPQPAPTPKGWDDWRKLFH